MKKRLVVKPIREEDREQIERTKKLYEENIRQIWEEIKQNREDRYMEFRERGKFKSDKEWIKT